MESNPGGAVVGGQSTEILLKPHRHFLWLVAVPLGLFSAWAMTSVDLQELHATATAHRWLNVMLIDLFVLLMITTLLRMLFVVMSVCITTSGVSSIGFWGKGRFMGWSEVEQVRVMTTMEFVSASHKLGFNPNVFTKAQQNQILPILNQRIPWFAGAMDRPIELRGRRIYAATVEAQGAIDGGQAQRPTIAAAGFRAIVVPIVSAAIVLLLTVRLYGSKTRDWGGVLVAGAVVIFLIACCIPYILNYRRLLRRRGAEAAEDRVQN